MSEGDTLEVSGALGAGGVDVVTEDTTHCVPQYWGTRTWEKCEDAYRNRLQERTIQGRGRYVSADHILVELEATVDLGKAVSVDLLHDEYATDPDYRLGDRTLFAHGALRMGRNWSHVGLTFGFSVSRDGWDAPQLAILPSAGMWVGRPDRVYLLADGNAWSIHRAQYRNDVGRLGLGHASDRVRLVAAATTDFSGRWVEGSLRVTERWWVGGEWFRYAVWEAGEVDPAWHTSVRVTTVIPTPSR